MLNTKQADEPNLLVGNLNVKYLEIELIIEAKTHRDMLVCNKMIRVRGIFSPCRNQELSVILMLRFHFIINEPRTETSIFCL